MKRIIGIALWLGWITPAPCSAWEADTDVLLRSFVHFSLAQEVRSQAMLLADNAPATEAEQIRTVTDDWFHDETGRMRTDLDAHFGEDAREQFEDFVADYTAAENTGDPDYLYWLATHTDIRGNPADYAELRQLALARWLNVPLAEGIRLLSEIQTWADLRAREPGTPALDYWLERDEQPRPETSAPQRPINPLAAAEASPPEWQETGTSQSSSLDAFAQRRRERREQAMQSAQAGMQQMALERQSAEQEYAARVMAEAQADAEAMRAQAQKLATAEAEAMAQRENSWGNRIKRIVGATVSAGVGAFTGGVGAEAGRRAADEVFR